MKFTDMDIKKKIEELKAEREKQLAIEEKAHKEAIAINVKIRKLETVLRDAGEILFEDVKETSEANNTTHSEIREAV
jgi:hypothetical protein